MLGVQIISAGFGIRKVKTVSARDDVGLSCSTVGFEAAMADRGKTTNGLTTPLSRDKDYDKSFGLL